MPPPPCGLHSSFHRLSLTEIFVLIQPVSDSIHVIVVTVVATKMFLCGLWAAQMQAMGECHSAPQTVHLAASLGQWNVVTALGVLYGSETGGTRGSWPRALATLTRPIAYLLFPSNPQPTD